MTGREIHALRMAVGLTPIELAQLVGVRPSTVYRWEQHESTWPLEPFQRQLLAMLQHVLGRVDDGAALGASLREALLVGGTMRALYVLLDQAFSEHPAPTWTA